MLHLALQEACRLYHEKYDWGGNYASAKAHQDMLEKLEGRRQEFLKNPAAFAEDDAKVIARFVRSWTRGCTLNWDRLLPTTQEALCRLRSLWGKDLISVDLSSLQVQEAIKEAFVSLASASGSRNENTGASKVLYALHPELFVMWDNSIRHAYGARVADVRSPESGAKKLAELYVNVFLPRVRLVALKAVREVSFAFSLTEQEVIRRLVPSKPQLHTLPKLLDEYNFVRVRPEGQQVWQLEYAGA